MDLSREAPLIIDLPCSTFMSDGVNAAVNFVKSGAHKWEANQLLFILTSRQYMAADAILSNGKSGVTTSSHASSYGCECSSLCDV